MTCRKLTDFEKQNGYSPCPFLLGQPGCDVNLDLLAVNANCNGTFAECIAYENIHRFGGILIPGHPVGAQVLKEFPNVVVTFEEETEGDPRDA